MNPQRTSQSRYLRFNLERASGSPRWSCCETPRKGSPGRFPPTLGGLFLGKPPSPILPYTGQISQEREDSRAWFLVLPTPPLHGILTLRSHVGHPAMSLTGSVPTTPALSLTLSELLKQTLVVSIFRVSFKTGKLLRRLHQGLVPQEVEFLRDPLCPKSELVQGRPRDAPVAKLCRGPRLVGERSRGVQGATLEI